MYVKHRNPHKHSRFVNADSDVPEHLVGTALAGFIKMENHTIQWPPCTRKSPIRAARFSPRAYSDVSALRHIDLRLSDTHLHHRQSQPPDSGQFLTGQ